MCKLGAIQYYSILPLTPDHRPYNHNPNSQVEARNRTPLKNGETFHYEIIIAMNLMPQAKYDAERAMKLAGKGPAAGCGQKDRRQYHSNESVPNITNRSNIDITSRILTKRMGKCHLCPERGSEILREDMISKILHETEFFFATFTNGGSDVARAAYRGSTQRG